MQTMNRQWGKLRYKSPGNNAQVAALLSEYEDVDRVLHKITEHAKSWKDAWTNVVLSQLGIVTEYEGIIDPITGASDGHGKSGAPTSESIVERTAKLREVYTDLKTDLLEEIALIDSRVIGPLTETRDCIAPFKKSIKKRENRRLEHEQAQQRHSKLQRKMGRNPKEDKAVEKAEGECATTKEAFDTVDVYLRQVLPPVVASTFEIVPPVMANMILIQNRLLGLYYTALHGYCEEHQFPSPPPPMEQVVEAWSAAYMPARQEIEALPCVASGKMARQGLAPQEGSPTGSLSHSPENGMRKPSFASLPSRPSRMPSIPSIPSARPSPPAERKPSRSNLTDHLTPTDFTAAARLANPGGSIAPSPSANPRTDYFGHETRRPSASTTVSSMSLNHGYASSARTPSPGLSGSPAVTPGSTVSSLGNAAGSAAAIAKKKKPPPPPPKRIGANKPPEEFVVAQYNFDGQGGDDLSFREGDRIRIVKKTQTDQDWWVGELGGREGSFPANYCKAA